MNEHIKTVGYLLKNYTNSQCYDQYVELDWLKEQIKSNKGNLCFHEWNNAMDWILKILEG